MDPQATAATQTLAATATLPPPDLAPGAATRQRAAAAEPGTGPSPFSAGQLGPFLLVMAQLALLVLVVKQYRIEVRPFRVVFAITVAGAAVHHFLPGPWRLPFFTVLSGICTAWTLGPLNAALLIGVGLVLVGLCHLPGGWRVRLPALLLAGAGLAVIRAGWVPLSYGSAVLTMLGSIFMFRLIGYAYDLSKGAPGGFWRAAGYFFMLPNACFPLFPIVDYRTFCRGAGGGDPLAGYHTGIRWICRGILHLLLLRWVNARLALDIDSVVDAGTLFQYMLAVFLAYLRVSGTFHIIVGMLNLFGFGLPETHHHYMLASSVTDFWRRINIYWKEFIQKIVFYPLYFRLKRLGPTRAVVLATALSMAITWALHSYQWFWLKGDVLLTAPDVAFWATLGVLLTINTWYETRFARRRVLNKADRSPKAAVLRGVKTSATMAMILVLWSMWYSDSFELWFEMLGRATNCSARQAAAILGCLAIPGVIAAVMSCLPRREGAAREREARAAAGGLRSAAWAAVPTVVITGGLLLLSKPAVQSRMDARVGRTINALLVQQMNQQSRRQREKGYYGSLTQGAALSPELANLYVQMPPDWEGERPFKPTGDFMLFRLEPSRSITFNQATVTTNRWAMRDREYDKTKPAGVYRMAMAGESHAFGNGVEQPLTFKQLVEDRVNQQGILPAGVRLEFMNFSVPGHGPLSKLAMLERQAFEFEVDAVIQTAVSNEIEWAVANLAVGVRSQGTLPYEDLNRLVARAGVSPSMTQPVLEFRLKPYGRELLQWIYGHLAEVCRQRGVRPYVALLPKPSEEPGRERAFAEIAAIARGSGLTVLDVQKAYDGQKRYEDLWIAPWDEHPNALGHRLLAETLFTGLRGELAVAGRRDEPAR